MGLNIRVFTLKYESRIAGFDDGIVRRFLANKTLVRASDWFFVTEGIPHLAILVEYSTEICSTVDTECSEGSGSLKDKDRRASLSDSERELYDTLREWRRNRAGEDGIPVFLIASNSMLLDVVEKKPSSLAGLRELNGFGEGKVKKYGAELLGFFSEGGFMDGS